MLVMGLHNICSMEFSFDLRCESVTFKQEQISLSTVVLNSRDHYEKLWLPALLKTTLQQALAEKTNLDALVLL